jgi:predicted MFS family arabinose efflux permease
MPVPCGGAVNAPGASRVGYGAALSSREFRALFAAQLISITGTSIAAVALTVIVFRRTGSPLLASLTFALGFLPSVLGGTLLSGIVDRLPPRRLVVGCALLATPFAAAMAWPSDPVWSLLVLLFGLGMLSSLAGGANASLVRSTVPHDAYVPARSLMRMAAQFAQIGGNAAGGVLLVLVTPRGALLLNAASFAIAALSVRFGVAEYPSGGMRGEGRLLGDSLRGARAVFALPELRRLMLVGWIVPMFSVAPEALAAPYVAARHGSTTLVGWWLVALPLGVIIGDVAGVRLLSARGQRRLVAPAAAAGFLPYLVFLLEPSIPLGLGLLVVSGACSFYALGLDGRVRDAAPPRLFPRTMALNYAGLMSFEGIGFALAGAIAQGVGPGRAIALAGACGLLATVVLLRADLRSVRRR